MNSKRKMLMVVSMLVMLSLALPFSAPAMAGPRGNTDIAGMPQPALSIKLDMPRLPVGGGSADLNVTLSAIEDAPDTTLQISLPAGVQVESGELIWRGDLKADQEVKFSVGLRFAGEGEYEILASARSPIDAYNERQGEGALAVRIGAQGSQLGLATMDLSQPQMIVVMGGVEPMEDPEPQASDTSAGPLSAQSCGTVRAYGWAYFTNADNTWTPAVNAGIELWDLDNSSADDYLGSDIADSSGYWSIGPVSQADGSGCGLDLYYLLGYDSSLARVENANGDRYMWSSLVAYNVSNGTYNFDSGGIPYSTEEFRARHLYLTLHRAQQAFATRLGVYVPKPAIQYRHGDNSDQTWPHFKRSTDKIYLPGVGQDWSDYNKQKTVLHELGHHVHWKLYGDWMPVTYCPSPHYTGKVSHYNCAWTEGWATWIALFVNNDSMGRSYDYDHLPACGDFECGADVEGRVTASLWDLYDSNNEDPLDKYSSGAYKIWNTVDWGGQHNDFWEFWVAYKARYPKYSGDDTCYGVASIAQNNSDGADGGDIWFNWYPDMMDVPDQTMAKNTTRYIDFWDYAEDDECRDSEMTYVIDYVSNPDVGASVAPVDYIKLQPATNWTGWSLIRVWAGDGPDWNRVLGWDYDYFWVHVVDSAQDLTEAQSPPAEVLAAALPADELMAPLQEETPPAGTPAPMITPTASVNTPEPTEIVHPPEASVTPLPTPTKGPTLEPTPTLETPPLTWTPGAQPTDLPTATPTNTPTPVPTSFPPTPTAEPPRLGIKPAVVSLKQHQVFTFTASNGAPPYTWYGTGGIITPSQSYDAGLWQAAAAGSAAYQAGDDRGNFVLTVRDNAGTEAKANILIGGLEISTKVANQSTHIKVGGTVEFKVDDLSAAVGDNMGGRGPFLWILDGKGPTTAVGTIQSQAGGEEAVFTAKGNGMALVTAYGLDPDGQVVNSNSILVIVGNTLAIPDTKGVVGQEAVVRINLSNIAIRPVSSFEMTIVYLPDMLTFKSVEPTFRTSKFTVGSNKPANNKVKIILTSLTGETIEPGRGPILDLTFNVVSTTARLDQAVNIDFEPNSVTLLDNQSPPQEIEVQTSGGTFSVVAASALPHDGDVDGNDKVNVRDLAMAVLIFLERYAPSTEEFAAADLSPLNSGDGEVNVTDVLKIFNKALGKPISLSRYWASQQSGTVTLRVPNQARARVGEELLVPVVLNHTKDAVGGLDVSISYTATTGVYTPTLGISERAEQLKSEVNTGTEGRLKVIMYSPDTLQTIAAGQGQLAVLNFGVVDKDVTLVISATASTVSDANGNALTHKLEVYDPNAPNDDPTDAYVYLPVVLKAAQ